MADILLAAVATTRLSITAAILQMISHGLISALLFLLVGVVYKSCSRDVDYLRRFIKSRKRFTNHGNVNDFSGYGSWHPGMVGFIAEFLVFRGSFPIFPIQTLLCLVASGLTAVYFLLMINRVFFGRLTPELSHIPAVPGRKISRNCFGFIYYCSGITTELDDSLE
jgi:NAD(P)H-quinone oxidoreductase subunit 4